jgi:hypothetical protein
LAAPFLTREERALDTGTLPLPRASWRSAISSVVGRSCQPPSVGRARGPRGRPSATSTDTANDGLAGMRLNRTAAPAGGLACDCNRATALGVGPEARVALRLCIHRGSAPFGAHFPARLAPVPPDFASLLALRGTLGGSAASCDDRASRHLRNPFDQLAAIEAPDHTAKGAGFGADHAAD